MLARHLLKPASRQAARTPISRIFNIDSRFNSTSTNNAPTTEPQAPKQQQQSKSSFWKTGAVFLFGSVLGASYVSYKIAKDPPVFLFPPTSTTPLSDALSPTYGDPAKAIEELTALLGPTRVSSAKSDLDHHSDTYWSTHHATEDQRPDLVVFPESTEEVSNVLKICHKHKIPVIPFTGGTSLEGQFIPTRKGICVDLSRMHQILELHKDDLDVVVQPAVGWEDLKEYLADYDLLFGPDPGPGACIGGMIGTSCSGTNAARYGTMRENVLGLTVVLADGSIIKTKKRPRKSSAGYNLTGLIIGSEGTLGIVTEATLKLNVKPRFENVAVISFPTLSDAANSVAGFVQQGIPANAMELLDENMVKFVNESGEVSIKYDEAPTLMLKLGGNSKESVKLLTNSVKAICKENNNKSFKFAETEEEKFELWNARKAALWSTIAFGKKHVDPDVQVWTTDVAVPISKLAENIKATKEEMTKAGFVHSIVGHVGDGNYHALLLYKNTPEKYEQAKALVQSMVDRAILDDGTVTGEHGVGYGKRDYLISESGEDTIALMRKIKFALDPHRILNPDKVFKIDPSEPEEHH